MKLMQYDYANTAYVYLCMEISQRAKMPVMMEDECTLPTGPLGSCLKTIIRAVQHKAANSLSVWLTFRTNRVEL